MTQKTYAKLPLGHPVPNLCPTTTTVYSTYGIYGYLDGFVHHGDEGLLRDLGLRSLLRDDPFLPQDVVPFRVLVGVLHFDETISLLLITLFVGTNVTFFF